MRGNQEEGVEPRFLFESETLVSSCVVEGTNISCILETCIHATKLMCLVSVGQPKVEWQARHSAASRSSQSSREKTKKQEMTI